MSLDFLLEALHCLIYIFGLAKLALESVPGMLLTIRCGILLHFFVSTLLIRFRNSCFIILLPILLFNLLFGGGYVNSLWHSGKCFRCNSSLCVRCNRFFCLFRIISGEEFSVLCLGCRLGLRLLSSANLSHINVVNLFGCNGISCSYCIHYCIFDRLHRCFRRCLCNYICGSILNP